jgi:hypothetical protein
VGAGGLSVKRQKARQKRSALDGRGWRLFHPVCSAFSFLIVRGAAGYFSASGHLTISQAQKAASVEERLRLSNLDQRV